MSNRFAQTLRDLHWISLADRRAKEFKTLTRLKTIVKKTSTCISVCERDIIKTKKKILTPFQTKICHYSHPFPELASKKLCHHYSN